MHISKPIPQNMYVLQVISERFASFDAICTLLAHIFTARGFRRSHRFRQNFKTQINTN